MRWMDIIAYCFINMKQRKLRTCLTVFGVMTGIASVIAFVSIAIGYRENVLKKFCGENDAAIITVTAKKNGNIQKEDLDKILTEERLEDIKGLSHVVSVSPELEFQGSFQYEKYAGNVILTGIEKERLHKIKLEKGVLPEDSAVSLQMIICENVKESMYYTVGNKIFDFMSTGETPNIDLCKDISEIKVLDESFLTDTMNGSDEYTESEEKERNQGKFINETTTKRKGEDKEEVMPKYQGYDPGFSGNDLNKEDKNELYMETEDGEQGDAKTGYVTMAVKVSGLVDGETVEDNEYKGQAFTDVELLKEYLMNKFGKGNIPGQPKINAYPISQWVYTSAKVYVDDLENVSIVIKKLKDMGFKTENNKALRDAARRDISNAQLIFGGIGLIALFVATIGIANTMFMTIIEREKTIGIIKVLGGRAKDIMKIYLCESAIMGFLGGIGGGGISFFVSFLINYVAIHKMKYDQPISALSIQLVISALIFAVFIGVISGYFPAKRAMEISVVEAVAR